MDENDVVAQFKNALQAYEEAGRSLRSAAKALPPIPETLTHGTFVDVGYQRFEDWNRTEDGKVSIVPAGWDAYTESSDAEWLEDDDGNVWRTPDMIEWD